MGIRGPLPTIRQVISRPLPDLKPPEHLGDYGKAYWRKHSKYLTESNILTEQTYDTFAICCALFQRLRELDNEGTTRIYLDTLKGWQNLAKLFRLTPTEKPGEAVGRFDDSPAFPIG